MKTAARLKLAATVASVIRAATRPGGPSIGERVQAVPRLVRATVEGRYAGTTLKRLGLVVGALAYVVSPIDLLPEAFLPVVGAADDALVIGWAMQAFVEETDRFVAWEGGQRMPGTRGTQGPPSSAWTTPQSATSVGRDETGAAAWQGNSRDGARDGSRDEWRSDGRGGLPEGVREAATDYVMERVRKRLER